MQHSPPSPVCLTTRSSLQQRFSLPAWLPSQPRNCYSAKSFASPRCLVRKAWDSWASHAPIQAFRPSAGHPWCRFPHNIGISDRTHARRSWPAPAPHPFQPPVRPRRSTGAGSWRRGRSGVLVLWLPSRATAPMMSAPHTHTESGRGREHRVGAVPHRTRRSTSCRLACRLVSTSLPTQGPNIIREETKKTSAGLSSRACPSGRMQVKNKMQATPARP
ncbi:hypothetical protein LZ30DRAFT_423559 [Colletotrichum cereale]|nr:hypothetical protein LZ30DRAFT_423559 [Colletotrichum cereale]